MWLVVPWSVLPSILVKHHMHSNSPHEHAQFADALCQSEGNLSLSHRQSCTLHANMILSLLPSDGVTRSQPMTTLAEDDVLEPRSLVLTIRRLEFLVANIPVRHKACCLCHLVHQFSTYVILFHLCHSQLMQYHHVQHICNESQGSFSHKPLPIQA